MESVGYSIASSIKLTHLVSTMGAMLVPDNTRGADLG